MFSYTVRWGNSAASWNMRTMPRRCAGRRVTSCPSRRTRPAVGASRPARQRRSVDFPLPFGPSRTNSSPGPTAKVRRSRTGWAPHAAERPSTRRTGSELDTAPSHRDREKNGQAQQHQEAAGGVGGRELARGQEPVERDRHRRGAGGDEEVRRRELAEAEREREQPRGQQAVPDPRQVGVQEGGESRGTEALGGFAGRRRESAEGYPEALEGERQGEDRLADDDE